MAHHNVLRSFATASMRNPPALPETHLILAWLGSYSSLMFWLYPNMDWTDFAIFNGIFLACLPVISRQMTPRLLACLGGPICGLISGMQIIDLCFDICILHDRPISDGFEMLQPRRLAWVYYHMVLNAPHVNSVLLGIIVICFLGSIAGIGRSSPEVQQRWLVIGAMMSVGVVSYLGAVMPRYLTIRKSSAFEASMFDGWQVVIAARLLLFLSIIVNLPLVFSLQLMPEEAEEQKCK
eukprot:CAMPEP_0170597408 /NCGR_PEP_ID=MMETSP0224-20130122/15694_1 /TAXON_ID=285029 /ORGANISM="Togula jolla, Strain CCCM 725" /LENGTH=236 /DNA_ID=CAMNT_0010921883 /DNA_START=46 /DNA_END=756 /DNA_ORIENTATION=+